ncbi:hypothetical protein BABINDRAFT_161737 [Babjeviella inositovora NRRL Y-12698]|uniref:ABC transporter domain-containing protein n=1 Tax=Babjeviella inositovora NRRL Y-12698 TaxID=984486 RepID=A0A1E3QQU1_9ASCO|nr:uncharacterized protein BABINDRAFT_161737 [Babjeviella inositovora NRRL Y-12698]ODQ79327.1 hypothetical protein BABINDRAFT_161737 [Babjeviella inositovora NRRL Y-12698]
MTCFMSCLMIALTASGITEQLIHIQKARVAAVKIAKFLNTKKLLTTPSFNHGKLSLYPDQFLGNISFKNVSFAYPSRKHQIILKSVSLSFKANQTTFIVGVSGSSKSTLFQLLFGFYLPSAGRVDVDGFEVRNVNEGWLTDNITLVQQECILFNDTIRNNITMTSNGNDPETSDRFAEACKIALVNEMVEDFPDGLETNITAKGTSLSGGQRQRVALARAIFKNLSVLILDEAVSALDISLRRRVMFNIRKWRREKTTIITTHELDTISPDDYVYVMEDGKVCESGTSQLLELQRDSAFSWLRSRDREGARELEELPRENSVNPFSNAFRVEDNVYFEFSKPLNSRYSAVSHKFLLGFSESPSQHGYVSESSIDLCDHKILSYHTPISSEQEAVELYKLDTATRPYKRTVPSTKISTEVMGVIEILRFMMGHIRKKLHLVLGVICAVINGASNPVFSFAFSKLISGIITSDKDVMDAHFILKWSIIVIAICIVDSATTFGKSIFLGYAAEMWILECRKQSFDSISKQEVSWFSGANRNPAEISALLMNDTRDLRNLVSEFLSVIGSIFVLLTVGIIWALVTGWKLSLVGISLIPLFALCTMAYSGFLRFSEASYKVAVAELENQVHDTVDGIRTIKCLNMKRHFCHLFDTQRDALLRLGTNRAVHTGMGVAINSLITYLCQSILMYYGVRLVAMGTYTSGQMFLVFTLLVFSMTTAGLLMGQLPDISRGQRAGTYIVELLRLPPSDTETSGALDLFSIFQAPYPLLEFRDVTFAYPSNSDVLVLDGLNLQIHKGETVCIMGQSGSGKSTIASLMSKLYCPTAGSALWNGVPVTRLLAFWLRSQIAVVPQTATFFEGTLRDNLLYGLAELVSDAQYEELLKMANIYDFTVSLPQGLETRIGGSSNLLISGGQAQRLSIARALLRRPKILIMDECTSALDTENTQIIADLITNNLSIQKGLTTIVITHSESLMRASSRILTIKEGAVCELGSFQRLYNRRGEFFRIVASGRQ